MVSEGLQTNTTQHKRNFGNHFNCRGKNSLKLNLNITRSTMFLAVKRLISIFYLTQPAGSATLKMSVRFLLLRPMLLFNQCGATAWPSVRCATHLSMISARTDTEIKMHFIILQIITLKEMYYKYFF
jgi:hypothetical protein